MAADLTVRNSVAVADPDAPSNVIKPNADGSVNVVGGGSGATSQQVQGSSAANAAATGNPVQVGGIYESTPATYDNLDAVPTHMDSRGSTKVILASPDSTNTVNVAASSADNVAASAQGLATRSLGYVFNGTGFDRARGNTVGAIVIPPAGWGYAAAAGGITNTTTAVTIKAAAGAGIRNYISSIQISADALGAATELAIRDGAGGPVLWRTKLQTSALDPTTFVFPIPIGGTAATLLEVVTLTASVTGSVYVDVQGFAGP